MAAITAVLLQYDTDLIREVTDPRTGISTTEKHQSFLPTSGELKRYCEGLAARKERLQHLGTRRVPAPVERQLSAPDQPDGHLANVFIPRGHQRFQALGDWAKTAERRFWKFGHSSDGRAGIWIPLDVWDRQPTALNAAAKSVLDDVKPEAV